ncbi:DUF4176 domain-containing protein [Listeria monocytogenes]
MEKMKIELQQKAYRELKLFFESKYPKETVLGLHCWLTRYTYDCTFLYQALAFYDALENDRLTDCKQRIEYEQYNDKAYITVGNVRLDFPLNDIIKIIGRAINVLEPLLPLGSVVKLREEMFPNTEEIREAEFVVLQRYIQVDNLQTYLPYGLGINPFGITDEGKILYAVPSLIKEVIHYGYQDEKELRYEHAMRIECNIKKEYQSVAFASLEVKQGVNELIRREGNDGKRN